MVTSKRTLQPEHETPEKVTEGKTLEEQNKELKVIIENDKLRLEHEAFETKFKTAAQYQEALSQIFDLQEQNERRQQEIAEREKVLEPREKALAKATKEAEKTIKYAEILRPLGEDRTKIVLLLREIRDKVVELVNLPDAFREFNKYGVEKEHDRLYVEIQSLIKTWLDVIKACKESMAAR